MHSSVLRGSDFKIEVDGCRKTHADFFQGFTNTRRLGVMAPQRIEGVGAAALIMAHVTAFFDTYRAVGEEFFAYPDFYTFQNDSPLSSYNMLDIFPDHKSIKVGDTPQERLSVVTDRAVNILVLPDGEPAKRDYDDVQMASARRTIDTCYVYSFDGVVKDADITIQCRFEMLKIEWIQAVFDTETLTGEQYIQDKKAEWNSLYKDETMLKQSFRRISLEDALARL